ncbi:hypothetical protein ACJX0J_038415, partial [Zea mays]
TGEEVPLTAWHETRTKYVLEYEMGSHLLTCCLFGNEFVIFAYPIVLKSFIALFFLRLKIDALVVLEEMLLAGTSEKFIDYKASTQTVWGDNIRKVPGSEKKSATDLCHVPEAMILFVSYKPGEI